MAIWLLLALPKAFFIRRFLAMSLSSAIDGSCVSSCATSEVISSGSRTAAHGDRRSDKRPSKKNRVRWGKWVLALVLLCASTLGGFAPSTEAQTAHFSWAIATLGRGFNSPQGVAVDASGNIFVADSGNNAVEEL
jgi:DNA-binding beta-propeller fold protein YncE